MSSRLRVWGFWMAILLAIPVGAAEGPSLRLLGFSASDAAAAHRWRQTARTTLFTLLAMDDQTEGSRRDARGCSIIPLRPEILATEQGESFTRHEVEIDSRGDRRIAVVLTLPKGAALGVWPAVVCIHGHGGNRDSVYDAGGIYRGFAAVLAARGYVTLSTNVGQHEVQDQERTLMGERLWDLMRLVDLAVSRPEVDCRRIGCAGLSLGGEMAMWLGAMDTRIAATVSSGFLTTMENLRHGHCMCWDFPGLQRRYEFADIYSLMSPRPLQCQNGRRERLPGGFPGGSGRAGHGGDPASLPLGRRRRAVELAIHPEGHVFDVDAAVKFLDGALQR